MLTARLTWGILYENGRGVTKDFKEALGWYQKAAEQGNGRAQHKLGIMDPNGNGVSQDDKEAVKWYRKAAEQGNADGQDNQLSWYEKGLGVTQDYKEAAQWARKAADQGTPTGRTDSVRCTSMVTGWPKTTPRLSSGTERPLNKEIPPHSTTWASCSRMPGSCAGLQRSSDMVSEIR